ncbi:DUF4139 domain-containing protein [Falsiroseomonas sp. HW251]|uniref:DUF4139 domain-containing protein n=1 Tax=Falsiroseomonas sp. HW251 TaxID=3390998 RepID=UPI003D319AB2
MRLRHLLPLLCVALPAAAQDLPVRAVTLSNAGLAQVERAGTLAPDAAIAFRVPVEDVDDVLKSLLVRDPLGTVQGVRLPARDLAAEAFRGLPLRPDDFANRLSLLRGLRGQSVAAGGVTGRLVDADEAMVNDAPRLRLTLVTAEGLRGITLQEADTVRLTDPELAARVQRAAEALAAAASADTRGVEIRLSGAAAPRDVSVAYVAAAPLWKPSWRLVVPAGAGEARLQGWAVVENRTGADWDGVRLSLVSGNPAAFAQSLYSPIRVQRPTLPVRVAENVQVRPDTGAVPPPPPAPAPAFGPAARGGVALAAPAPAPATQAAEMADRAPDTVAALPAALSASAAGRVAFTLPSPVTVRGGETANLPFLDATLPAERLWWVQDLTARNPLSAVRLRNTTGHTLPDGLATVYGAAGAEAGQFLGDAEVRAVAPEETRLIAFARDRDVRLSSASSAAERPVGIETRRGVVAVRVLRREESALALDPRAAADQGRGARVVVDLPRRANFAPRFDVAAEGDFGLRTETVLAGGEATLRFAWERELRNELAVWDAGLGDPLLLRWREFDVEQSLRRLPGGPGTLENLRIVLDRLSADAPGREKLATVVERLAALRGWLDAARNAIRQAKIADGALQRARAAAEDRTGAEREEARRRLTAASIVAEQMAATADTAWDAWARGVQQLLAGME